MKLRLSILHVSDDWEVNRGSSSTWMSAEDCPLAGLSWSALMYWPGVNEQSGYLV